MPSRTVSATVCSSCAAVYRFLADIENIPKGAPGFCERVELGHQGWWAYTPQGEMRVELETVEGEDGAGVIHLRVGPSADRLGLIRLRAFPVARKRTRVDFTLVRPLSGSRKAAPARWKR